MSIIAKIDSNFSTNLGDSITIHKRNIASGVTSLSTQVIVVNSDSVEGIFGKKSLFSMFDTKENSDPVKDITWKRKRLSMLANQAKASGAIKSSAISSLINQIMKLLASAEAGDSTVTEAQINQKLQQLSAMVGKKTGDKRNGVWESNNQGNTTFYESESKKIAYKIVKASANSLITDGISSGLVGLIQ